ETRPAQALQAVTRAALAAPARVVGRLAQRSVDVGHHVDFLLRRVAFSGGGPLRARRGTNQLSKIPPCTPNLLPDGWSPVSNSWRTNSASMAREGSRVSSTKSPRSFTHTSRTSNSRN